MGYSGNPSDTSCVNGTTGQGIAYIDYTANPIALYGVINLQAAGSTQITGILPFIESPYQPPASN
jgi:hypothetical protein